MREWYAFVLGVLIPVIITSTGNYILMSIAVGSFGMAAIVLFNRLYLERKGGD